MRATLRTTASRATGSEQVQSRVDIWLIAIAIGSGFVLMPGQSRAVLAAEILVVSAGGAAYTVWTVLRMDRWELPSFSADLIGRWLGMGATWLLSIGAGISLL